MTTLGLIVANRGFFPGELCLSGRETVLRTLSQEGYEVIAPTPEDTRYGTVQDYHDARKCADLFRQHAQEIEGILVTLPNFGDERSVADAIRLSRLDVPVLVHAFPDDLSEMGVQTRRDSFCGKMSVCNNLMQYGIPFTLTSRHTEDPTSDLFRQDLRRFGAICRIVRGLRHARFGQVGARPGAFITVRYSEKLLEQAGISVESIDLSEVIGQANRLADSDPAVQAKLTDIKGYLSTNGIPSSALVKMGKLAVVLDRFIEEHDLDGTAIQCWTALEEYYGVVPCTVMSMLSDRLKPSACETDITGLIGMYAMALASGRPSALLDWNNNYGDDPDKAVVFHCSNLPQDIFGRRGVMDYQAIIAGTVGRENTYGTLAGHIEPTEVTYCRVSTDDALGTIRAYLGEAQITDDPVDTFGGYGVIQVPRFQDLLAYICENGFEHHVALNPGRVADALNEALAKYMGWDVYYHTP